MNVDACYVELGQRIRMLREMAGVTQTAIADKVGLTRTSIVNIEMGRQRLMLHDIPAIGEALGVKPDLLLNGLFGLSGDTSTRAGRPRKNKAVSQLTGGAQP